MADIEDLILAFQAYVVAHPDERVQVKADLRAALDAYIDERIVLKSSRAAGEGALR